MPQGTAGFSAAASPSLDRPRPTKQTAGAWAMTSRSRRRRMSAVFCPPMAQFEVVQPLRAMRSAAMALQPRAFVAPQPWQTLEPMKIAVLPRVQSMFCIKDPLRKCFCSFIIP